MTDERGTPGMSPHAEVAVGAHGLVAVVDESDLAMVNQHLRFDRTQRTVAR